MKFTKSDVLNEWNMIVGMPIQGIEDNIEGNCFQHFVGWFKHILAVLEVKQKGES